MLCTIIKRSFEDHANSPMTQEELLDLDPEDFPGEGGEFTDPDESEEEEEAETEKEPGDDWDDPDADIEN